MENFRFLTFLSKIVLLTSSLSSCQTKELSNHLLDSTRFNYRITLIDTMLTETIQEYIETNHIDGKKAFITLYIEPSRHRTRFYISHSIFVIDQDSGSAIGYTTIAGILTVIYSDLHTYINNPKMMSELKEIVKDRAIVLSKQNVTFDPPVWNMVKCGDQIIKRADTLAYDLPCGLRLGIDRKANKFIIEEEDWLKEARAKASKK